MSGAGKGDNTRPTDLNKFRKGMDRIFGDTPKTSTTSQNYKTSYVIKDGKLVLKKGN